MLTAATAGAEPLGVPVPARSRLQETGPDAGLIRSSRGFRQTVRYYRKHFKRRGIDARQIPTYAYRGVTIARFLAPDARSRWRAVHVFRHQGRTYIHIVPAEGRAEGQAVHKTLDRDRKPG